MYFTAYLLLYFQNTLRKEISVTDFHYLVVMYRREQNFTHPISKALQLLA